MPRVKIVTPKQIPQPYRSLLVHDTDMTLTLERHFGDRVTLRPLSTFTSGRSYFRRVLLVQKYSGRPGEMGAIRIRLDGFSQQLRSKILRDKIPLGRLLRDGKFDYESRVKSYLCITPTTEMMGVFWMSEARSLYGSRTEVIHNQTKIGDIGEITLPIIE